MMMPSIQIFLSLLFCSKNEDGNMLLDNMLTLPIPLKYEIELTTHG